MATSQEIIQLVINTASSQEVYDYLEANGLVKTNEIWLVAGDDGYVLPPASANLLGGVIIGSNISASADGTISVPDGSTTTKGVLMLLNSVTSTDTTKAATAAAVKQAYDLANGKANPSDIPTKTSQLTNDSEFLTAHQDISGKLDKTGDGSNVTAAFTAASTRTNILTGEKLSVIFGKIAKWFSDLGTLAFKSTVEKSDLESSVQTSLGKADSALQSYTETDPTVPAWAKAATKPSYTASEVGALPDTTTIPTKTSQLTNDSGFLTQHQDISGKLDKTGDGSSVTAAFTQASSRANIATGEKLSVIFGKIMKWFEDLGSLAFKSTVSKSDLESSVQTSLGKADTALQSYTETDPTVPSWAKESTKPSYTASEVGALPDTTTIPTKTSQLTNDSGFLTQHQDISGKLDKTGDGSSVTTSFTQASTRANLSTGEKLSVSMGKIMKWFSDLGSLAFKSTVSKSDLESSVQTSLGKADSALQSYTETDPTVPAWAKASTKPSYTASEVGALPSTTTIPSKTSQLTNDSGFLTQHQDISWKLDKTGDGSSVTTTFTRASSRSNLTSGEKLSVAMGKISKWFADLGSLAFKSTVAKSDLASDVQTSLGKADSALQSFTESDPTVPSWAKASTKPTYTASEVGALPSTLKSNYDTAYNHSQSAHAPSNAQENVIEAITCDSGTVTVTGKTANIVIQAISNDEIDAIMV